MSYLWIRVNLAVSITLVMLTAALGKSLSKERTVANSTEKLPFDSNVIFTVPLVESVMGQHRQRFRRSDSSSKYIDVTLPTPSEDIVLRLASTKSLLVPGATFEIRSNNITTATPVRNDCYFQGKVLNTNESFAALSICNGLIGVFEYEGSQYSIEPFDVDSKPGEDNYHKLHSIKKMNKTGLGYEGMVDSTFHLEEEGEKTPGRRFERAATSQKFLEVMVVIDKTVVEFHGEQNTEVFILALFNMINLVYSHSSLGVNIKLSLVKLVLLEEETADKMWEEENPRDTLDKFCMWSAVHSLREHEVGHYDFAMYLSRGRMTPAGYAPVTGMCRPDRSCALIKEDGFSTAFVAAHEIGHTIGMSHDGEGINKCVNEPKRGSIMAPLVMANLNNYFWSPCSKEEISSIISTLYCMNDDPFEVSWSELEMPLGRNWDLDEQCVKDFGEGFKLCSRATHNFNPCEHLWCSTPDNRYLCKTKRAPPLPGSTCATDRWCFNSKCIVANPDDPMWKDKSIEQSRLQSVDGSWSHWSSWSECSTTCGRGIKSRTRQCDDPEPSLGGKDCPGLDYDLRLCDLPTCEKAIDDVRLDQCTHYNKRGRTYVPYETGQETSATKCLLHCRAKEQDIRLYGEIEARDGTFCSYDDRNSMCYAGKCIPVGCDGKINSGAREDTCGVCKGDNSQCTLRQDYFNNKLNRGYQLLVRLYPGTRNLKLVKPNDAFRLVLRNTQSNQTVLSETTREPFTLVDYGSLWKYSNTRSETLETSGPLQAEYELMIYSLYNGMRATMSITFTEPLNVPRENSVTEESNAHLRNSSTSSQSKAKIYGWAIGGWGECSVTCGEGFQERSLVCKSIQSNKTVQDVLCKGEEKPATIKKSCLLALCDIEYRWVSTKWSECPTDVCQSDKPTMKRWSLCVRDMGDGSRRWDRVKDTFCSSLEKPAISAPCNTSHCVQDGYWRTGRFSQCSVTCGAGTQVRDVTCLPIDPQNSRAAKCDETVKPSTTESCANRPCFFLTTIHTLSLTTTTTTPTSTTTTTTTTAPTTTTTPPTTVSMPTTTTATTTTQSTTTTTLPTTAASTTTTTNTVPITTMSTAVKPVLTSTPSLPTFDAITITPTAATPAMATQATSSLRESSSTMLPAVTVSIAERGKSTLVKVEHESDLPEKGDNYSRKLTAENRGTTTELNNRTWLSGSSTLPTVSASTSGSRQVGSLQTSTSLRPAPENTEQTTPRDIEQTTPENTEQTTPRDIEQTTPENTEQTTPENTEHTTSEKTEHTTPEHTGQTTTEDIEQTTAETSRTRFVWWWTATTSQTPTATQLMRQRTTTTSTASSIELTSHSLSTSENLEYEQNSHGPTTTVPPTSRGTTWSNHIQDNISGTELPSCKTDLTTICDLMNGKRCKLPLFKKLCCLTCTKFVL